MARLGQPLSDGADLRRFIGPPLLDTFLELCGSKEMAAEALILYRERFGTTGANENAVYNGVPAMLRALCDRALYVCTSKPTLYSQGIVDHFGLSGHFEGVYGSEMDGTRADKGALIQWILEKEHLSPEECVMVGDRHYDIIGAAKNGLRAHGVLWGYGTRAELLEAGADVVHEAPSDLAAHFRRTVEDTSAT
jgi:phosphoglycolate phosphatase